LPFDEISSLPRLIIVFYIGHRIFIVTLFDISFQIFSLLRHFAIIITLCLILLIFYFHYFVYFVGAD